MIGPPIRDKEAYETGIIRPLLAKYGGACWPLDDQVGVVTVRELSGLYPGTPSATGVTLQSAGPTLAGTACKAAAFDGAAGKITASNTAIVDPATQDMTVAMWFNATNVNVAAFRDLVDMSRSNTRPFMIGQYNAYICAGYYNGSAYKVCNSPNNYTTGWHHICATKTAGDTTPTLYIDSVLQTGEDITPATAGNSDLISFGSRRNGGFYLNGSLAYAAVLPAALTPTEIYALYKAQP